MRGASSSSRSLAANRLAVLSRQLAQGGEGGRARDDDGENGSMVAAAPTFSTSTSSATSAPPTPPPTTVVVLGGCVMDVVARPSPGFALSRGGSVPGSVSLTPGGVGRNIAVALAGLLPLPLASSPPPPRVRIVSVVGSDPAGDALVSSLEVAGVDASGVCRLAGSERSESVVGSGKGGKAGTTAATTSTPVVVAVHEAGTGDVAASVADVAAVEESFTPELVKKELSRIARENGQQRENGGPFSVVVVVDGNLSAAAVAAASSFSSSAGISLFEPVSVAKGVRAVKGGKLRCTVMTPNAAELLAMARAVEGKDSTSTPLPSIPSTSTSGSFAAADDVDDKRQSLDSLLRSILAPAARALISRGVCDFALVTLGERGAALIGREEGMRELQRLGGAAGLLAARARKDGNSRGIGGDDKLVACVVPAAPVPGGAVVSTGGAGDAFAAGFLAAAAAACRREGAKPATVEFALAAGAAAAAQVVASPLSSPKLDAKRVWRCAQEVERRARWSTEL